MKRKAGTLFAFVIAPHRADDRAPSESDAAGGRGAVTAPVAACQCFAEPPEPIPRAPFALSAGLGAANVRAIRKGDLDLVRAANWQAEYQTASKATAHASPQPQKECSSCKMWLVTASMPVSASLHL